MRALVRTEPDTPGDWSNGEIDVIARAVVWAPSVHNIQPWRLELLDDEALLYMRETARLPEHDPKGCDVAMSCGAAVANLELAVRALGRSFRTELLPDPHDPDLIARVTATGVCAPASVELHRYSAIARRRSYRRAFSPVPLSLAGKRDLLRASPVPGVEVRPLGDGEEMALAGLMEHAGQVLQHDDAYQRELAAWTIWRQVGNRLGSGIARSALPRGSMPWAGLVRPGTALPDSVILAERLAAETILIVVTPDDSRLDHVRAGMAMEYTWLAAVDQGLAGAVMTQPLRVSEVRAGMIERLDLAGYPQLLMRIGHPAAVVPQSPRRAVDALFVDDR